MLMGESDLTNISCKWHVSSFDLCNPWCRWFQVPYRRTKIWWCVREDPGLVLREVFPNYLIWSSRLLIPSQNMRNNFIYIYIFFFSHSLLLVFSSFWKLSQISCTLFFNDLLFTAFFCPIPILWIERWSPWVLKAHRNRKDLGIPDSSHWGSRESHLKVETQIEQMMEGGIYRE